MKVLRIKLKQEMASYAVPEMINNRISYPLPPFSTIIGALHSACGYSEYHEMKVSIQGKYSSMQKEVYINHGLIDNLQDDRGELIWLYAPYSFNSGYISVAKALANTGNSFNKRKNISIFNEEKLSEYTSLFQKKEELDNYFNFEIKPLKEKFKLKEKNIKTKLSSLDKNTSEYKELNAEMKKEKEKLKEIENKYNLRKNIEYIKPRSHFKLLTKGPQTWEVLYNVELVIHISASETIIQDILKNKYNLISLGRSEDFIELIEMKIVELTDEIDDVYKMHKNYSIYANTDRVDNKIYVKLSKDEDILGTVYYVPKNYHVQDEKRIFNKIPCLHTSLLIVDMDSSKSGVYIDKNDNDIYIVDLN